MLLLFDLLLLLLLLSLLLLLVFELELLLYLLRSHVGAIRNGDYIVKLLLGLSLLLLLLLRCVWLYLGLAGLVLLLDLPHLRALLHLRLLDLGVAILLEKLKLLK